MSKKFIAACIQLNSKRDLEDDIPIIVNFIGEAIKKRATFITLPECTGMMEPEGKLILKKAPFEKDHPILSIIAEMTVSAGVWVLIGSLAIKLPNNKIANRSYLFNNKGRVVATYDKIHMFDVNLNDGQSYRESKIYRPGKKAVLANLPWGKLGLTICYDLRFPYLYRTLAQAGAHFITVPSAFTKVSGTAHWNVLQRARAIETGCFIISAAQCGTHAKGRQTYGNSLIVNPWGTVLADGGKNPGVITSEINPTEVKEARRKIPAIRTDKKFTF